MSDSNMSKRDLRWIDFSVTANEYTSLLSFKCGIHDIADKLTAEKYASLLKHARPVTHEVQANHQPEQDQSSLS